LAAALAGILKRIDRQDKLPKTNKTHEELGMSELKEIMPETWFNISTLIVRAVETLSSQVIDTK